MEAEKDIESFHDFNLHQDLLAGIDAMGFNKPTPIQQFAIPRILDNKDLIACAQTGTGKTAAYLLPLLNKISHAGHDHTSTLILVPTRELAKQIDDQVEGFAYFVSASSIPVYGGNKGGDWDQQKKALTSGADIIIATPGRLIAHLNMGYVKFDKLEYLVLDEADKMLDMGFMDDLIRIINHLPKERQTLMFSATMPPKIRQLAKQILKQPEEISLAVSKPAEGIDQRFFMTYDSQKLPLLEQLIKEMDVQSMIVFTSRKSNVNSIVRSLQKLKFTAAGISSDMEQDERERTLQGFRNKQFQILVATDILSRGIDIDNISHVVNFDVPQDAEDYIHRIGRTARAASTGTALTFVNENDMYRVTKIERLLEREVPKFPLPDFLGSGPEYDPNSRGGNRRGGKPGSNRRGGSGGTRSNAAGTEGGERRRRDNRRSNRGPRPEQAGAATEANTTPRPVVAPGTEGTAEAPKRRRKKRNNRKLREGANGTATQGQNQQPNQES